MFARLFEPGQINILQMLSLDRNCLSAYRNSRRLLPDPD
jgi:hypothetical protein